MSGATDYFAKDEILCLESYVVYILLGHKLCFCSVRSSDGPTTPCTCRI
jgi:hypothetical protein